jgi:hypothetical protein
MIQNWKPWQHSTGPTSAEGKGVVARNADHGAVREILRRMARELRDQEQARREMAQRIVEAQLIAPDADS